MIGSKVLCEMVEKHRDRMDLVLRCVTLPTVWALVFSPVNEDNSNYDNFHLSICSFISQWYLLSAYSVLSIKVLHRILVRLEWEHRSRYSTRTIILDDDNKYYCFYSSYDYGAFQKDEKNSRMRILGSDDTSATYLPWNHRQIIRSLEWELIIKIFPICPLSDLWKLSPFSDGAEKLGAKPLIRD